MDTLLQWIRSIHIWYKYLGASILHFFKANSNMAGKLTIMECLELTFTFAIVWLVGEIFLQYIREKNFRKYCSYYCKEVQKKQVALHFVITYVVGIALFYHWIYDIFQYDMYILIIATTGKDAYGAIAIALYLGYWMIILIFPQIEKFFSYKLAYAYLSYHRKMYIVLAIQQMTACIYTILRFFRYRWEIVSFDNINMIWDFIIMGGNYLHAYLMIVIICRAYCPERLKMSHRKTHFIRSKNGEAL